MPERARSTAWTRTAAAVWFVILAGTVLAACYAALHYPLPDCQQAPCPHPRETLAVLTISTGAATGLAVGVIGAVIARIRHSRTHIWPCLGTAIVMATMVFAWALPLFEY